MLQLFTVLTSLGFDDNIVDFCTIVSHPANMSTVLPGLLFVSFFRSLMSSVILQ